VGAGALWRLVAGAPDIAGIGIVSALPWEARPLLGPRLLHSAGVWRLRSGALLAVSGIGAQRARAAAQRLLSEGVSALLSWGTAGALDPALRPGSLLLPTALVSEDQAVFEVDADWHRRAIECLEGRVSVHTGRVLGAARLISSVSAKRALWERYAAVAVDMETGAVAEAAVEARLPFLVVRAVVDPADEPVPGPVLAAMVSGKRGLSMARLVWAAAPQPSEWVALWRLGANARHARSSLKGCLRWAGDAVLMTGSAVGRIGQEMHEHLLGREETEGGTSQDE
jgi:adenosylhomocysteine nucleosidase